MVEIRSIEKWMELLSEFYGVSPKKPETDAPIPNENTDFSEWLSEAWWCVKHRSWKPIKERPVIEEDETPAKRQPQKQVEDISTTSASENPPLYPKTTVSLIFVGGDWRHAKHDSAVESIIEKKYGDLIEITWNHIDHSNQWHKEQDKICGQLGKADALILSPIIRTTMGWHLRREASKQSIPWIHCPTPGIQGVTKSLEEAVQTVCEIREPNK